MLQRVLKRYGFLLRAELHNLNSVCKCTFSRNISYNYLYLGHITVVKNNELVMTKEMLQRLQAIHLTVINVKLDSIAVYAVGRDMIGSVSKWSFFLKFGPKSFF